MPQVRNGSTHDFIECLTWGNSEYKLFWKGLRCEVLHGTDKVDTGELPWATSSVADEIDELRSKDMGEDAHERAKHGF